MLFLFPHTPHAALPYRSILHSTTSLGPPFRMTSSSHSISFPKSTTGNNSIQHIPPPSFPPKPSPPSAGKRHMLSRVLVCPWPTGSWGGMRKPRGKKSRMCLSVFTCNLTPSTSRRWSPKVSGAYKCLTQIYGSIYF